MARTSAQSSTRSLRPERNVESRRTATIALASNAIIAVAKLAAGVLSGRRARGRPHRGRLRRDRRQTARDGPHVSEVFIDATPPG